MLNQLLAAFPDVVDYLRRQGWYPGRDELDRDQLRLLESEGYRFSDTALCILSNLSGLTLGREGGRQGARRGTSGLVKVGLEGLSRTYLYVEPYERDLKTVLSPFGVDCAEGTELVVTAHGGVFWVYSPILYFGGRTFGEFLEGVIFGGPWLSEVEGSATADVDDPLWEKWRGI